MCQHLAATNCCCAKAALTTGEVLLLRLKSLSSGFQALAWRFLSASLEDRKPSKPCRHARIVISDPTGQQVATREELTDVLSQGGFAVRWRVFSAAQYMMQ
jgi:hypothetical protein